MQIAVGQGDTVVAHLFLYSQQATATVQSLPTTQPTPVFIEPTPTAEVVAVAAAAPRSGPRLPARLPETAVGTTSNNRFWLALGFATIALGSLLLMLPMGKRKKLRRTSVAARPTPNEILTRMLKDEVSAEETLKGLLKDELR
jgi:hypothetical protein